MKTPRLSSRLLVALFATLPLPAATVTWTQTGASSATSNSSPDDNMNWTVGANWGGGSPPSAGDDIVFGNVAVDTSAIGGVDGRQVVLLNTNFLGTGSLTLTQTSAFANNVAIVQNGAANNIFQAGAVTISSRATFSYSGQQTNTVGESFWTRQLTLGAGGATVSNAGNLMASWSGSGSNRYVRGYLSLAEGGVFINSGAFTLSANSPNSNVQGGTHVNALIGATTNTGSITINRSGSANGASDLYGAARGGVEFSSLNNSGSGSAFTFTVNNGTLLSTGAADPVIADRAAELVVAGALHNEGAFTLNRTPLKSKTGTNGATDNDQSDAVSRTVTARFGNFENSATGSFAVNHSNNATALTTTSSTVEITTVGAATNAGWLSLKGAATSTNGADGAILTRFVTQGGFSNADGGIVTVDGKAVLANTGAFTNTNTQASRSIQGATRVWDTRGLRIETETAANAAFVWATGVNADTTTLSAAAFTAANFTIGDLVISTGSATYTLAGGGDLFISGGFQLAGSLNLGDWTSVTTGGGQGQTLLFADTALRSYVGGLIADGSISATLTAGYALSTFTAAGGDAFYIGVTATAVPEPSSFSMLGGVISLAFVFVTSGRRRRANTLL